MPICWKLQIFTLHATGTLEFATRGYNFLIIKLSITINVIIIVEAWEYKQVQEKMQTPEIPPVETWLAKYKTNNSVSSDVKSIEAMWTYPAQLEMRTDLPPSIKKFRPEDFLDGDFAEWGTL